ncbi:hypothetical protein [Amycolatopsis sp. NPDC058986]|uniref:hypothetical protein n=1 Tax=unclassified Amycolatopsis TaxID=2618356 RepID=UPI003672E35A
MKSSTKTIKRRVTVAGTKTPPRPVPSPKPREPADVVSDEAKPEDAVPEEAEPDAPVVQEESDHKPSRRKRLHTALSPKRIVLGVVIVLLVAAAAFTGWQWYRHGELETARADATTAAGKFALDLTTYDYTKIDQNFKTVAANSTPGFSQQYQTITSNLTGVLTQYKAVSQSKLVQSGVVDASTGRAVLLLAVDQTITNTNSPQPRVERNRMQLTVLKQDGQWRLDDIRMV